jgi:Protein of unknown function (DUF5131)
MSRTRNASLAWAGSDGDYAGRRSRATRAALPPTASYSHQFGRNGLGRPGAPVVGIIGSSHAPSMGAITISSTASTSNIDDLVQRRFLSLEPLLGPLPSLDLTGIGIDWVIVGGESGPGFRPLDLDWVRDLRDRCVRLRIPLFFKQVGGRTPKAGDRELDGRTWDEFPVPVRVGAVARGG